MTIAEIETVEETNTDLKLDMEESNNNTIENQDKKTITT